MLNYRSSNIRNKLIHAWVAFLQFFTCKLNSTWQLILMQVCWCR